MPSGCLALKRRHHTKEGEVLTQTGGQPLSQVVPLLVAALVCDVAVADPSTGKKNLIGIFDRVHAESFPTQRPVSLYLKVTDAEGRYEISVKYVQANSGKMLAEATGEMVVGDRLVSSDFYLPLPPLPMPDEGRYEFQVWANAMFLGSTFIDAVLRPTQLRPRS